VNVALRRPPVAWLALQAIALWPHALWMWSRMRDGSDDPLGVVALAALALLVTRLAPRLRGQPDPRWLAAAVLLTIASTVATLCLPPLPASLVAALALAAGIAAWLPPGTARLPFVGLAVLALPLLSSLQFYAGYPLRLATAQLSTWLLTLVGVAAERSGATMEVGGRLIIVDAPCSGVQMAWMAYFTAFTVAALTNLRDAVFLRRLPWVGILVLAGNAVRNAVVVALAARPAGVGEMAHQATGVAMLAAVCGLVLWVMHRGVVRAQPA
jgi:exosortase/archaeosortase family protein